MASPSAAAPIRSPQLLSKSPKKELEFIITPKKAVDNNSESDAPDSPDLTNDHFISSNVSVSQQPAEQNFEDQNVEFRTLFRLPASEKILEDFYCAYFKTILHQGKMYVSQNYVCFHSNIFGFRIIVAIAFREIASISKQNTAYLVPNAIEIKTIDGASHFFGSFMFRDQTYVILTELLRIHKKRAKAGEESALADISDAPMTSDSGDESDDESDGEEDNEDDSDDEGADSESGYDTDTSSEADNRTTVIKDYFERSQPSSNLTVPIAKAAADDSKQTKSGGGSGSNESNKENRGNDGNNGEAPSGGKGSASGNGAGGDEGNKRNNDGAEHSIEESQTNEDVNEEDDDEDRVSVASDNITDPSQITWNDVFIDPAKVKPKEIYKGILPSDLPTCFATMFTGWDLERIYHTIRNDTELIIGDYEPTKEGVGRIREIKFVSPIKNPIGPKQSRIVTHQRVILQKGRKKCYNQFSMVSVDVPYGDCFKILAYVELTELEDKTTELRILSGVYFLRTVLLKWKIEDAVGKESSQSLAVWAEQAKKLITERPTKPHPKKHIKGKKRITKKKPKRTRKESAAVAPPPVFVPTSEPPPPAEEEQEGLLFSILAKLVGVLLTLPTTLITYSVHIPLWVVLFVGFMLTFFFLPQQYAIISTLNKVESELTLYKHQSIIMEQEMNYLLFNITHSATYEDFEKRLTQWLTLKKDREPDVLRSLLSSTMYELNQLRATIHEQHKKIEKFESSNYDKQRPEQPNAQPNVKLDPSTAVMMQMLQMNSQNSTNINMLIWVALGAGVLSLLLKLIKG